jgi:hypothetical protein
MVKPSDIRDETLRGLMSNAQTAIRGGDYTAALEQSAEAVRRLLKVQPGVFAEGFRGRARAVSPPMVGVRVVTEGVLEPALIFDRDKFMMSEALAWYQFALESIEAGEP